MALIRMIANRKTRSLDQKKNFNIGDKVSTRKKTEVRKGRREVVRTSLYNTKTFRVEGIRRRLKHYELQKVYEPAEVNPYEREAKSFDVEKQRRTKKKDEYYLYY